MITCHNVFHVWPKTTLLLPVWPRDAKSLDTPASASCTIYLIFLLCPYNLLPLPLPHLFYRVHGVPQRAVLGAKDTPRIKTGQIPLPVLHCNNTPNWIPSFWSTLLQSILRTARRNTYWSRHFPSVFRIKFHSP